MTAQKPHRRDGGGIRPAARFFPAKDGPFPLSLARSVQEAVSSICLLLCLVTGPFLSLLPFSSLHGYYMHLSLFAVTGGLA